MTAMTHEQALERSIEDANRLIRARGDTWVKREEWSQIICTRLDFYIPDRPKYTPEPPEMRSVAKSA